MDTALKVDLARGSMALRKEAGNGHSDKNIGFVSKQAVCVRIRKNYIALGINKDHRIRNDAKDF
jgi:hypothetical protein